MRNVTGRHKNNITGSADGNRTFTFGNINTYCVQDVYKRQGISVTPERQELMDFSIEYATSKQVVVVKKDAGKITAPEDVKEGTIAGVQMGTTADYYCQDIACEVKQFNKYAEAAMELNNGKLDCIVMDSLPAEQLVAANENLEILDGELFTDKYAIAVKKGNTELLDQLNEVLQKLVDEGKVDEFTINHTTK